MRKFLMGIVMLFAIPSLVFAGGLPVSAGGYTTVLTSALTCTAGAYVAGYDIGGKLTLTSAVRVSGGSGIINSLILSDKGKQNSAVDIIFFDADPASTTFTDNAALTVADADLTKIIGVVNITANDYASFADNSVATVKNLGLAFKVTTSTNIYATVVSRGTPTYASTSDLSLKVKMYQD